MGKTIVALALSLDGYAEGPGGDLSALPLDEAFNIHNARLIADADRLLYGATTYRMMVAHWPGVLADPDASQAEHAIARRCADGIPITVVSDTITSADTGPWREQTTIVPRSAAGQAVSAVRSSGATAVVFGSQTLASHLLRERLVDHLSIMISPVLVAGDRPALGAVPPGALRLRDVTRYPGSEHVVLDYDVLTPEQS